MPIKLHCEHCGKKIEAPDNAGGKWGKCPACHNKVYVPLPPSDDDEELRVAPLDEDDLQKQKQLLEETSKLRWDILQEQGTVDVPPAPGGPAGEISEQQLTEHIVRYLRQMVDGKLDEAQRTADRIVPHRRKAAAILEQFARSDAPDPELEDVPKQVLSGFIRNLRTRIS
ncbi:MAG: hypothetical protein JW955_02750 [Sedimentisphaerales bacterium]|nr:hypothetical protein [Sedimentisphaerales bacterium]